MKYIDKEPEKGDWVEVVDIYAGSHVFNYEKRPVVGDIFKATRVTGDTLIVEGYRCIGGHHLDIAAFGFYCAVRVIGTVEIGDRFEILGTPYYEPSLRIGSVVEFRDVVAMYPPCYGEFPVIALDEEGNNATGYAVVRHPPSAKPVTVTRRVTRNSSEIKVEVAAGYCKACMAPSPVTPCLGCVKKRKIGLLAEDLQKPFMRTFEEPRR